MELTSKQRAQLRSMANTIDTILTVGKDGVTENLIAQCRDALEARELVKGKVLENSEYDARTACEELCRRVPAEPVQVIGSKFVLYRPSHRKDKKDKIVLVRPKQGSQT
ncbi:MAG: YhbY family RNA-binding protein [Clostridiales bacterium]|nr:YhbY family RNA-binding protein [Clostridiales bacterium]